MRALELVLSTKPKIEEILAVAPEWQATFDRLQNSASADGKARVVAPIELFQSIGAKAIYTKLKTLGSQTDGFITILRDFYYQPLLAKMLESNQNLRRFWFQRRVASDDQKHQAVSLSVELAQKLEQALMKQLKANQEDGFKVLLPAYAQRSVHNAVVDYVRNEWQWEKDTLQDINLDPEQVDPRANVADDNKYSPENQALSGEQVGQLNQLRERLAKMLNDKGFQQEPLIVVDCMFGMGLTPQSKVGVEMTMRECCDVLDIKGETQARKIARCQVLLDKGLDMIRDMIRSNMPGVALSWQTDINVNSASRRELNHHLGLTEGEVDRLIVGRQYYSMSELVDRRVLQASRLNEIAERGAVAAFVPVDLNAATRRDLVDILGCDKEVAKKLVDLRPFASINDLLDKKVIEKKELEKLLNNGAVLKAVEKEGERINLNVAEAQQLKQLGLSEDSTARFLRARPFLTWNELEDFLCVDADLFRMIREKSCLTISPH